MAIGSDILKEHGLILIKEFNTFLSDSVCRVIDDQGDHYVVKRAKPDVIKHEYQVMEAFYQVGAGPKIAMLADNLLLMEDLGDIELRDDPRMDHLESVAQMLQKAHRATWPHSKKPEFLPTYLDAMLHARILLPEFGLTKPMISRAQECFDLIEKDNDKATLIHGDLHPKNIMLTIHGPRMIDPYGLWGNPIYDLAMIAVAFPKDQWQVYQTLIKHYGPVTEFAKEWFVWTAICRLCIAYHHGFPLDYRLALVNWCLKQLN